MKLSLSPIPSLSSLPLAIILARTANPSADSAARLADEENELLRQAEKVAGERARPQLESAR